MCGVCDCCTQKCSLQLFFALFFNLNWWNWKHRTILYMANLFAFLSALQTWQKIVLYIQIHSKYFKIFNVSWMEPTMSQCLSVCLSLSNSCPTLIDSCSSFHIREQNCVIWLNSLELAADVFYLTTEGKKWKILSYVFVHILYKRQASIPLASNSQSLSVATRVCPRINFPVYSPCRNVGMHKMRAFASSSLWPCVQICVTACMCICRHGHLQPVIILHSISLADHHLLSVFEIEEEDLI